ncbi:MAG: phage protein Gp37 [Spirochaetota bacterium]
MANTPGCTIAVIENAVLDALEVLKSDRTVRLRTLGSYQGALHDEHGKLGVPPDIQVLPAIWFVYTGSGFSNHGSRDIETFSFGLYVAAGSARSDAESRKGGSTGPGVYAVMEAARDALLKRQLGLSIDPLLLIDQQAVLMAPGVSVYSQTWETRNYHLFLVSST